MKLLISSILLLLITISAKAQFMVDVQGRPFTEMKYTNVVGTQFFNDYWINGTVELTNKSVYTNVPLKYSSFADEVFFKDSKSEATLAFITPVRSFKILVDGVETEFRNGYPAVDIFKETSYYQVVFDGKVSLLLKRYKSITENKAYNSAVMEKKFDDSNIYFMLKEGKMIRFKPSKKEIVEVLGDKSSEIEAFMKKEKPDLKNNADLAKLFEYYSSL